MGTSWTRFQSSLEEIKQNNCTRSVGTLYNDNTFLENYPRVLQILEFNAYKIVLLFNSIVWLAAGGGIEKYKMGTSWTRFQSSLEEIKQNNCTRRAALGLYI